MKALNYLKNKGQFLIAFVICCFALSCDNHKFANSTSQNRYEIICIGGHEYYESIHRVAIKLDDDGKPVKCKK